jgi:hypothetical protein
LVIWDVFDFVVRHEENSVGASSTSLIVTLGEATEFFTKSGGPTLHPKNSLDAP